VPTGISSQSLCDARFPISRFERQLAEDTDPFELLDACIALLASTETWAGLGEHLSAIETKLCAPMQWLQSNAGIWALPGRRFVFGQDVSQIQRQQLLKLSHNEDFAFGICFPIECHHASDYLERYVCSK
jgi:hypothetical protein